MTSDEIRQKAREYIIANPPRPITCRNCGMAIGLSVDCPKNEKGHLFMVTTGDSEQAEIDKLMGFAESLLSGGAKNSGARGDWCCECICHKVGLLGFFCCPCSATEIEKMVTCFGPHKQQPQPPAVTIEEHVWMMNPELRAASGSGTPATPSTQSQPKCNCGAGDDAYLTTHALDCSLRKWAMIPMPAKILDPKELAGRIARVIEERWNEISTDPAVTLAGVIEQELT